MGIEENTEADESIEDALAAAFTELTDDEETESTESEEEVSQETEASDETEDESTDETDVEEDSEDSEEPDEDQVFQAPEHWSSDLKEQFETLEPVAQEILLSRDKEFQAGLQEKVQGISAINEALEPWKDALAQRGVTADQAIRTLFAAQHQVETNPLQGILNIAQSYGVLDQLRAQFTPQETDDDILIDPDVKALKQQVTDLSNQIEQGQQQEQTEFQRNAARQIEDFSTAVDDDGNLKHPYFKEIGPQMAPLVQQGTSLEDAYNKVVWTVDAYREKNTPKVETDEEKAARVRKAKRASRTVKQKGNADTTEGEESLSLEDEIAKAYRQQSA